MAGNTAGNLDGFALIVHFTALCGEITVNVMDSRIVMVTTSTPLAAAAFTNLTLLRISQKFDRIYSCWVRLNNHFSLPAGLSSRSHKERNVLIYISGSQA